MHRLTTATASKMYGEAAAIGQNTRANAGESSALATKRNWEQGHGWRRLAAARSRAVAAPATIARVSDDLSELEDRQVHRDHQPADHHTEKDDDHRLEQARKRGDRIVDFAFVEVR